MEYDPIDNPPDLEYKKRLPKSSARFDEKKKVGWQVQDLNVGIVALALSLVGVPMGVFGEGVLVSLLAILTCGGALLAWSKNDKLLSRKGFNPIFLLYAADCLGVAMGIWHLFSAVFFFGLI